MRPKNPKLFAARLRAELTARDKWLDVFVLHWYEFMSPSEIARALSLSYEAVDEALDGITRITHDLKKELEEGQ